MIGMNILTKEQFKFSKILLGLSTADIVRFIKDEPSLKVSKPAIERFEAGKTEKPDMQTLQRLRLFLEPKINEIGWEFTEYSVDKIKSAAAKL